MDKCVVGAVDGSYYNDPCVGRFAVDSGILLFGWESGADNYFRDSMHQEMYNIKRISSSRFTIWKLSSGSNSFVSFTLDKDNLPPESPTALSSSVSDTLINLSWTAPLNATSYEIYRKTSATENFAKIGTSASTSYSDSSVSIGVTYWYRVFALNTDGTSNGSNVIKLTFNPTTTLSSSSIGIVDYIDGLASGEAEHKIFYSTANEKMTANLEVGKLDAENLNGLLSGSYGKSPMIKFNLANLPSAGMSGTATLVSTVLDGDDETWEAGERAISASASLAWESDGNKLTLTVPSQTTSVTLIDASGTTISGEWSFGGSSDLMTISSSGINKPVSLDLKLLEFLSSNIGANGPAISNFFLQGDYFYRISLSGFNLADSSGNKFTTIQGTFGVDSNPISTAYIEDVVVDEGMGLATALVTLSSPVSDTVKLDFSTSDNTAIGGNDYTSSSGSLRIAPGKTQGAFTIPLTDDNFDENDEQFFVTLGNISNANLGRSIASVTITDNDSAG